jgi:hypothetical protein
MLSFFAEIVAHLRHVAVAHGARGDIVAVDRVLHQRDAAILGGNGRAVDAQFAVGEGDDLFAPVAAEVGDLLDAALNARSERDERAVFPFADRATAAAGAEAAAARARRGLNCNFNKSNY